MRGIALEGGGAKGSFHIGAIKALIELGIDFQVVAGTSIGAINGAMIAAGQFETLETLWETLEMKDMIGGDTELLKKLMNFDVKTDPHRIKAFVSDTLRQGGIDVTPFKEKLRTLVDEAALRKSNIDYGLVTVSLTDMKPVELFIKDIPEGKLHDYIIASANIPGFADEKMDNKKMLDGAFFDNLPVNMLLERGCDQVIAIRVMGIGRIRKVPKSQQAKVITIEPSEDLGKTLEIDTARAKYNIQMGYYDTMRVMKQLHGFKYYLSDMENEAYFLKRLVDIKVDTLEEIGKFLNINKPGHRMMFEEMIPLLAEILKADKTDSYGKLVLRYYEFLAEQAGINRFEIMSYQDLVRRVNTHYLSQIQTYDNRKEDIVKRLIATLPSKSVLLFPQKLKNELLIHLFYILAQGLEMSRNYQ